MKLSVLKIKLVQILALFWFISVQIQVNFTKMCIS